MNLSSFGLNDLASSWKCGSEVFAILCDEATPYNNCNSGGRTQAGRISNPDSKQRNEKFVDVILQKYNELENPAAMFFTNEGCAGSSHAYFAGPPSNLDISSNLGFMENDAI